MTSQRVERAHMDKVSLSWALASEGFCSPGIVAYDLHPPGGWDSNGGGQPETGIRALSYAT